MSLVHIDKIRPKIPTKISGVYKTPVNGGELQSNWNMSDGTTGWTASAVTLEAVTDIGEDAVKMTAIDGSFDRGNLSISGLTIGIDYAVNVRARRGAQGTNQAIFGFTWCTAPNTAIDSTSYKNYSFNVTATATSGSSRVYAGDASGGSAGDEVYCSELSIREI